MLKKILYISLLSLVCFVFVSCRKNGNSSTTTNQKERLYVDTFNYSVEENDSGVSNELSYIVSFDIGVSLDENSSMKNFEVKVEFDKNLHYTIDYCNTDNIQMKKDEYGYPFVSLKYEIAGDVSSMQANVRIKITTKDLMKDINDFLKVFCYDERGHQPVDRNELMESGKFKMEYSSDTAIYYEFDEFSESYSVVSVITESKSLTIPAVYSNHPVKKIKEDAFKRASNIEELVLPNSLISLPDGLLNGMNYLNSLSLPLIGNRFTENENPYLGYLFDKNSEFNNSVPTILYTLKITGGESILANTFLKCASLRTVIISDSVTSIGESAFAYCSNLTNIEIPDSVTTIGKSAFFGSGLKSIKLSNGITHIEQGTFSSCLGLSSITIPNTVISIGNHAFSSITALSSIELPDSVTSIGDNAFSSCIFLHNIVIPKNLKSIGEYAFYNCKNLKEVYYKGSEIEWNSISISSNENDKFKSAKRYFYSETKPTENGNYWHYVDGVVTKW